MANENDYIGMLENKKKAIKHVLFEIAERNKEVTT